MQKRLGIGQGVKKTLITDHKTNGGERGGELDR